MSSSMPSLKNYSIPKESKRVFREAILENPLVKPYLPAEASKYAEFITYEGDDLPSLPINWRMAESIVALKSLEGTLVNILRTKKFNVEPVKIHINTDHAQLFIFEDLVRPQVPELNNGPDALAKEQKIFPSWDKYHTFSSRYRTEATNIYKAKNGFFHIHGSFNAEPVLKSLGMPLDVDVKGPEESWPLYAKAVGKYTTAELEHLENDVWHQAGTTCLTREQFRQTEQAKANEHVGLYEIEHRPNKNQKASWWPDAPSTSADRPLSGLKVIDLTRAVAGPAMARSLAELGASVMRVISPKLPDLHFTHVNLAPGKWQTLLDLEKEEDKEKLRELIRDADVFLQGYRPDVMDNLGFSKEEVFDLVKDRERGILYVTECAYGFYGPRRLQSGWQQLSDAQVGISYEWGRAMGIDEPVTPFMPNSDFCTGVAGSAAVLAALIRKSQEGGSFYVTTALNYYNRWLSDFVGTYPEDVWQDLWGKSGNPVLRHYHDLFTSLPMLVNALRKSGRFDTIVNPDFFYQLHVKVGDLDVKSVKPILRFDHNTVKPGFQIGPRTDGTDKAKWPTNLLTEVVV